MPHLAGAACGVCRKELMGFRDGAFCPTCESPVHVGCARSATTDTPATVCPRCGTPKNVAEQWRERETACENESESENSQAKPRSVFTKWMKLFGIFDVLVFSLLKRLFNSDDETPSHLKPAAPIKPEKKKPWKD